MKNTTEKLQLSVRSMRNAGLEAKWSRTQAGRPALFVRNPKSELAHQRNSWWMVTNSLWVSMQEDGVLEAFTNATLIADAFSVTA